MAKFHIAAGSGDIGPCKAVKGKCPFGDENEHYDSAEAAREAFEAKADFYIESGQVWPPPGLPKRLAATATTADLIRHHNDTFYDGGAGVCLGASAFISHDLLTKAIPHKLVRGEYITAAGIKEAHWWAESRGWIIDASRGQFEDETYRSGVIRAGAASYSKSEEFDPGHSSRDLVEAEMKRCFGDPYEAVEYLEIIEGIQFESEGYFDK